MACHPVPQRALKRRRFPGLTRLAAAALTGLLVAGSILGVTATDASAAPEKNPFPGPVGGGRLDTMGQVLYPARAEEPPPPVDAEAFLVADLDTGEVLATENPHRPLPPAGTVQTLTGLALIPRLDPRAVYTVTADDLAGGGPALGLERGDTYSIERLFGGMFLTWGSDAAAALTTAGGGPEATAALMHQEAHRLGGFDTEVADPSGGNAALDVDQQHSSVYDLALFARAGLTDPDFDAYVRDRTPFAFDGADSSGSGKGSNGDRGRPAAESNDPLAADYPGAFGLSYGRSGEADHALVAVVERDGKRLVAVILGAEEPPWDTAADLFDWGLATTDTFDPFAQGHVGELVTKEHVRRADTAATEAGQRVVDPAAGLEEPAVTGSGGGSGSGPDGAAAADENGQDTATAVAGRGGPEAAASMFGVETLWLWAAAALFMVLAGLRVRAYVRSQRDAL